MPLSSKTSHEAGKQHMARKREIAKSQRLRNRGKKKTNQGPKRVKPQHNTDNDSFDEEDLRGLLYDIDTQWGLLPGGGAYKESNHYFGCGIDDDY
ncbi:hypothetical protein C0995_007267 [Termitomyces sp. Mi166|nr:hypothetical protein C0995_007267 [Termitomyces sp. Mi166\